jgi:hypothetical protein
MQEFLERSFGEVEGERAMNKTKKPNTPFFR